MVAVHRAIAAADNAAVADKASGQLLAALSGDTDIERILIKAAAGAGKSYVLKKLVEDAVNHVDCRRVAVVAFQNRQLWPIAKSLGERLGKDARHACSSPRASSILVPDDVPTRPLWCESIRAVAQDTQGRHMHVAQDGFRLRQHAQAPRGRRERGAPFDVLFVDEAWQLPHHLFDPIEGKAPITVGVGDVGQLPPLEIGTNPWRGDPGFNPYRAWPTNYYGDAHTFETELPAVWRPTAEQLPLWRAFYPEWAALNCVAAPGDRHGRARQARRGVAADGVGTGRARVCRRCSRSTGWPTPKQPTSTCRSSTFAEWLLDELFAAGFSLVRAHGLTTRARRRGSGNRSRRATSRTTRSSPCSPPGTRRSTTRRTRSSGSAQAVRPDREGPDRVDRRLVAGADERHHGRDPPADRRRAARRVQLPVRPPRRHLHARHPRTAHVVAAWAGPAAPGGAGSARHAVRRAGEPAPAAADSPAHPRHVRARHR